jgi:hypothetical protein
MMNDRIQDLGQEVRVEKPLLTLVARAVELPDAGTLAAASESLDRAGFEVDNQKAADSDSEVVTQDPWGTQV